MKTVLIITTLGVLASAMVFAAEGEHKCTSGNAERKITIVYPEAGKKTPCEVKYLREGASEEKILFSAKNEEGYCDTKAHEFIEKLKGLGWQCAD